MAANPGVHARGLRLGAAVLLPLLPHRGPGAVRKAGAAQEARAAGVLALCSGAPTV